MQHSFKQALAFLLCFVMLLSLVLTSCEGGNDTPSDTSGRPTESTEGGESGDGEERTESDETTEGGDSHNHNHKANVIEPTCTVKGYTTYTCDCGDSYVADEVAALGHTFGEWIVTKDPTEADKGEKRRDCSDCDYFEIDVVAELSHDHSKWEQTTLLAVAPTCTTSGLTEGKKCSGCGETLVAQESIPALGHTFGEWFVTKEPTETDKGEKRRDCSNCDCFEIDVVAELSHDHSRWEQTILSAVAPTCTTAGLTEGKKCSKCEETIVTQESIPANGHSYSAIVTEPTCTVKGYTTYTCDCGDSYVADEKASLGHTEVTDAAFAATCITDGKTEGKHCSVCNTVLVVQTIIPAVGHSYSCEWERNDTHHWHKANCEHVSEISEKGEHVFGGDLICNICQFEKEDDKISFKTLQVNGTNVYGKVSNNVTMFSFLTEVAKSGKATYAVFHDLECSNIIHSQTATLMVGDNTFYILEYVDGAINNLYIVTIRRKPMYTVTFDTEDGTSVASQVVEEDSFINAPETSRKGYTFISWDYDFNAPITKDTHVTANWSANTNTPYKVEYHLENLSGTGYDLVDSYEDTGKTDTTVTALMKEYAHFTYDDSSSNASGNLDGDGSRVLKLYYTRNTYTVSANIEGAGNIAIAGDYPYGTKITLSKIVPNLGYSFDGWYVNTSCVASVEDVIITVDANIEARFNILPEMQNFLFASTQSTCTITGIINQSITEIVVPDYVTMISEKAFSGCNSLEKLTIPFVGTSASATSYEKHFGAIFSYWKSKNADYTKPYAQSGSYYYFFTIPSSLVDVTVTGGAIGEKTFINCASIVNLTIADGVTDIGDYAFDGCDGLKTVIIGNGVKNIGTGAFAGAQSYTDVSMNNRSVLETVVIGSGVETIGSYAFWGCLQLQNVTIKAGVKVIGTCAFAECNKITTVELPNTITTIEYGAFMRCTKLEAMVIPDSVTTVGTNVFRECIKLASVTLGAKMTSIGDSMFYGCVALTSVEIPDSVKSIGNMAFGNCTALRTVTVGSGLESIWAYAFSGSNLSSFTLAITSGWYRTTNRTNWENKQNGTSSKPTASSLKSAYSDHYWYRV